MKMPDRKMIPSITALCLSVLLAVMTLILPKSNFSEQENRMLQTDPGWSSYVPMEQKHVSQMEVFLQDQFFATTKLAEWDHLRKVHTGLNKINGVYVLADRLIVSDEVTSPSVGKNNTDAINGFAKRHHDKSAVYAALLPTASEVYADLLPRDPLLQKQVSIITDIYGERIEDVTLQSTPSNKKATSTPYGEMQSLSPIDVHTTLLGNKGKKIFYQTDTGFTSFGSYQIYSSLIASMRKSPISQALFHIEHAKHEYFGDLYRNTHLKRGRGDVIDLYHYANAPTAQQVIKYNGQEQSVHPSVFFREFLEQMQKTNVFLGGNCGITRVVTKSGQRNQQKLLLFADAAAKPVIPFLALHYADVTFVNLRYFTKEQMDLIQIEDYQNILFLYSLSDYLQDTSISEKLAWLEIDSKG